MAGDHGTTGTVVRAIAVGLRPNATQVVSRRPIDGDGFAPRQRYSITVARAAFVTGVVLDVDGGYAHGR